MLHQAAGGRQLLTDAILQQETRNGFMSQVLLASIQ